MFEDADSLQERARAPHRKNAVPVSSALLFILLVSLFYGVILGFAFGFFSSASESSEEHQARNELVVIGSSGEGPPLILNNPSQVECSTTKGNFRITLSPETAPNGVAELTQMVRSGFFEDVAFFRVNDDITQFGVKERKFKHKSQWERDEHPLERKLRKPWKRGDVAMIGGTQMIIVKKDSRVMGLNDHDTIVGRISAADMTSVLDRLYRYNDIIDHPRGGPGPDQTEIYRHGWEYLNKNFPLVDRILKCELH